MIGLNLIVYQSIIGIGLIGNFISLEIFSRKNSSNYNDKNMIRVSLIIESLNLLMNLLGYLQALCYFETKTVLCKIFQSSCFILPAYSACILVFISVERFTSIVVHTSKQGKKFLATNKWVLRRITDK